MADRFLQLLYPPSLPLPCLPVSREMSPSVARSPFGSFSGPTFTVICWLGDHHPATRSHHYAPQMAKKKREREEGRGKDDARIQSVWVRRRAVAGKRRGAGEWDDRGIRWIQRRVRRRAAALREMISRETSPG